jgi:hypothetical protein
MPGGLTVGASSRIGWATTETFAELSNFSRHGHYSEPDDNRRRGTNLGIVATLRRVCYPSLEPAGFGETWDNPGSVKRPTGNSSMLSAGRLRNRFGRLIFELPSTSGGAGVTSVARSGQRCSVKAVLFLAG